MNVCSLGRSLIPGKEHMAEKRVPCGLQWPWRGKTRMRLVLSLYAHALGAVSGGGADATQHDVPGWHVGVRTFWPSWSWNRS